MHPDTAKQYGISDGDAVVIETKHGQIMQFAKLKDSLDRRVLNADHGWWYPEGAPETQFEWQKSNFNMLTSTETLGKEYGTPNLKAIGCKIRRDA